MDTELYDIIDTPGVDILDEEFDGYFDEVELEMDPVHLDMDDATGLAIT